MASGLLHHGVPVDVGEQPQTEPVPLARVREAVHSDAGLAGVEGLSDPGIELVVGDGTPECWLAVHDWLGLQRWRGGAGLTRPAGTPEVSWK